MQQKKLVSIGFVVFNGEKFIHQSLDSLLAQKYNNFELIISDNNSTDNTEKICREYESKDKRVKYYKNKFNIGVFLNFKKVLHLAKGEYFMWASHDDVWHPDFIFSCVNLLENNKNAGFAFSNIVNIDSFSKVIKTYPSFKKFAVKNNFNRLLNYVKDSEKLGKANIIYSVYRLEVCKKTWEICPLDNKWGSDMVFVLSVINRYGFCVDERVLFQKRITENYEYMPIVSEIKVNYFWGYFSSIMGSIEYVRGSLLAVKDSRYFFLVSIVFLVRLFQIILNRFLLFFKIFFN